MALRVDRVGQWTAPREETVDFRRCTAYAAGIGETDPRYLGEAGDGGLAVVPALCTALEWPVINSAAMRELHGATREEAWGGIHVQQDSRFHALPVPGQAVRTRGRLVRMRPTRRGTLAIMRLETHDSASGLLLVESWFSMLLLGLPVALEAGVENAPELPELPDNWVPAHAETLPVGRDRAHLYTECADIWNPIHTEPAVARARGLPGIILHGTCTWAMAGQCLVRRWAGGEPARLQRLAGRFTAMVRPGEPVRVESAPDGAGTIRYRVRNADGADAVAGGIAWVGPAA